MRIEEQRARQQHQRGANTVQVADTILENMGEEAEPNLVESVKFIRDTGAEIQKEAIKSERWMDAGGNIVGPPPEPQVDAGDDAEDGLLVEAERQGRTMGKARSAVQAGKKLVNVATQASGGTGVAGIVGQILATVTAVGTVAEVGRRKFKSQDQQRQREREEDERKRQEEQREKDRQQDEKMDTMMGVFNAKMMALENKLTKALNKTGEEG
jgi:hypothetical protein